MQVPEVVPLREEPMQIVQYAPMPIEYHRVPAAPTLQCAQQQSFRSCPSPQPDAARWSNFVNVRMLEGVSGHEFDVVLSHCEASDNCMVVFCLGLFGSSRETTRR